MSSYHYSFYSPTDCTAWVFSHRFHCLLSIFSHGFTQIYTDAANFRGCTCLKCTNQPRSAPTKQNRYSPTESTEPTELLAECILPRNPQNLQNFLLSIFSHRLHRFTQKLGCLQGGALVSSAPTKKCTNQAMLIYILLRWCT